MAILADMKAYYRWLDEASDRELADRRANALAAISEREITNRDVIREANHLIRLIEEEIISRKMKM